MTKQINPQAASTPIVDRQGRPTLEFFALIEQLTALEIREGDINPENNVTAKAKTLFWNSANNTLWFKATGPSLNTGWLQISQDM